MSHTEVFERQTGIREGMDAKSIRQAFERHLLYTLSKDRFSATLRDVYQALALAARDRMVERWIATQHAYYKADAKRVYYLSAEYLMGRLLINSLLNLGIYDQAIEACRSVDLDLRALAEQEPDQGLGNGGLGRLAACFLDSMTALEIPAYGYGIRYEFGIFKQAIRHGGQVELPDKWLESGNPWEIPRPERTYNVRFHGRVIESRGADGRLKVDWVDGDLVQGMAYDTPIDGYDNESVNTLRLWQARASKEFDLGYFHHGDYMQAVAEKNLSENISKVLYPNVNIVQGRELRLKQQYFFVSCSLQDILRRYLSTHDEFDALPDKIAIQLNDTHPALAVAELMRLLVDVHGLPWERAWELTVPCCAYTNHTLLAEALEKWPTGMLGYLLPRHLQIIFEINRRFLQAVAVLHPGDEALQQRLSLIEEGPEKQARMAHLAIVGSHSVNGVSELHTKLLRERELADFDRFFPDRFNAKTNGITPRRWLIAANPALASLLVETIGDGWKKDLGELRLLEPLADDAGFRERFATIKRANKERLAARTRELTGVVVDPQSIFDVQIKRIHQYKRQTLNALQVIAKWLLLKQGRVKEFHPRTYFFAGKAAPDYRQAKQTIQLLCQIADTLNRDVDTNQMLKVVFLPNYSVSLAETIIPAADVSEQISTAGYEASGTGNMKFALNGAVTIGTLDGANVEIREEVGNDNIFIFGLDAEQVVACRRHGYEPRAFYQQERVLREALDLLSSGYFSPEQPDLFAELVDELLTTDHYLNLADFSPYLACQRRLGQAYTDRARWSKMAVLNVARSGKFSSDRTIAEYNRDIWRATPVKIHL